MALALSRGLTLRFKKKKERKRKKKKKKKNGTFLFFNWDFLTQHHISLHAMNLSSSTHPLQQNIFCH
jgi:hypothetical protein